FSSRRRHTRSKRDWSSDVCSSDLVEGSTASDTTEETQAMPAPDFDEDPAAGPEPSEGSTVSDDTVSDDTVPDGTVPDDQAPPLRTPDQGADDSGAEAPDRPTVAPAASQQNQAPHPDPSAQNGGPSGSNQSDGTWA